MMLPLKVLEREAADRLNCSCQRQDARGCRGPQERQQRVGESEWREVVHGECPLETVHRLDTLGGDNARVVDQHVNAVDPLTDRLRQSTNLLQRREVGPEECGMAVCADGLIERPLGPIAFSGRTPR